MMLTRRTLLAALLAAPVAGLAASPAGSPWLFRSIDGGDLDLAAFRGGPVIVVNTASRCQYTPQYGELQAFWEAYRDRGVTVVAIPSDSFGQEFDTSGEVKDFCELTYEIDFPMSMIEEVRGPQAHPFYVWAAAQGVAPTWNFHKILLDGDGNIAGQFDRFVSPESPEFTAAVEALLPDG